MTEFSGADSLPSSPTQADLIVRWINGAEMSRTEDPRDMHDVVSMLEELPIEIEAHMTSVLVGGYPHDPRHVRIFTSREEMEAHRDAALDATGFTWFDSNNPSQLTAPYYRLQANADLYKNDPELFDYLIYQQVADIDVTKFQEVIGLPVQLVAKLSYSFWTDKAGAYFIHRQTDHRVTPSVEGLMLLKEQAIDTMIMMEVDVWEKGSDSIWHTEEHELSEDHLAVPDIWANVFNVVPPSEDEIEDARAQQAEMLAARLNGHGIVDEQEAAVLISMLVSLPLD